VWLTDSPALTGEPAAAPSRTRAQGARKRKPS